MKLLFFLAFLGAGIGVAGQCARLTVRGLLFLARHLHKPLRGLMVRLKPIWLSRLPPRAAPITLICEPDWKKLAKEPAVFRKGPLIG